VAAPPDLSNGEASQLHHRNGAAGRSKQLSKEEFLQQQQKIRYYRQVQCRNYSRSILQLQRPFFATRPRGQCYDHYFSRIFANFRQFSPIFSDFRQFSDSLLAFFSKTNVMILFSALMADVLLAQIAKIVSKPFGENILKNHNIGPWWRVNPGWWG
jgi:hypothetical protein